jgi:hypothetical protein
MPDNVEQDSTAGMAPYYATNEQEYEALNNDLSAVMQAAMASEDMQARYQDLIADVDDWIAEQSYFYRGLISRREEIEARFAEAEETGEQIAEAERGQLLFNYQNIQYDLGRAREWELVAGEFTERFWAFKMVLFDRMRELAPTRSGDIDRLQELERDRPVAVTPPIYAQMPPPQVEQ